MPQMTGEYPRAIPRTMWLTARARNAVHRPCSSARWASARSSPRSSRSSCAAAGSARDARDRAAGRGAPGHDAAASPRSRRRARVSPSPSRRWLAARAARRRVTPTPTADTLNPQLVARRDSLARAVNELDALLTRVETRSCDQRRIARSRNRRSWRRARAPRRCSIHSPRSNAIAKAFGSAGGTDPVFVALTSRATDIGQAIQALAQARPRHARDS